MYDKCFQSLSENEAENLRLEYMSRLSKNMTGLPVEVVVDEMESWDKIGNHKRIKFQGNKDDKIDFRKLYSMSIENKPRVLVKDAEIELTADELKQVKDFVSINKKYLLLLEKGNIDIIEFSEMIKK